MEAERDCEEYPEVSAGNKGGINGGGECRDYELLGDCHFCVDRRKGAFVGHLL